MLKLSHLVIGAVLGFTALGHGANEKAPEKPTPDYIKVEVRGKFRVPPRAKGEEARAQVVVRSGTGLGEKCYELDLPTDKVHRELAQKLDGKAVLITGELVTIYDFVQSATRPYPPRDIVRVKTLKAAGPDK